MTKFGEKGYQVIETARVLVKSALFGGNLAALALLSKPREALSYIQYGLFGWRMIHNQGLPMRQLHDLFPIPEHLSVEVLPTKSYLTNWDANYSKDMLYLAMLVKALSPKTIFEIGTYLGEMATIFALNSPEDAVIYTLDLPPDDNAQVTLSTTSVDKFHISTRSRMSYLYASYPSGKKITQLFGDSARFDFAQFHNQVDLFFIDGAHSYEYVRSDTLKALQCVKNGGVIAWHDYGRWGVNGVSRWLHEYCKREIGISRLPGSSLAILKVKRDE